MGLRFLPTISFTAFDNDFDTGSRAINPEIWSAETLEMLAENIVMAQLVRTDFSKDIASYGDTVNTRLPGSFTAKRKGVNDDVTIQPATAVKVPVVLDQHVHTSFLLRDGEESLSMLDLIPMYLAPAALSLAQQLDRILLGQAYQFRENQVAVDPDGSETIKNAILKTREKQNINKVPVPGRNMILTPSAETEALDLDLFLSAEKVGDDGTALREASLGRKLGYNTFMCQNASGIETGTSTTPTTGAAGTTDGAKAAGTTVFVMTTDATSVLKAGMYVTIAGTGGVYRITAIAATSMTIDQPVLHAVPDDSAVTYYTQGAVDLTGDSAATAYPAGFIGDINVAASGVIPQVGQLVGFADSDNDPVRSGEYSIISVDDGSGAGDYYISLDRPLDVAIEDTDVIQYGPVGQYNFAFDRDALALVIRPLAQPLSGAGALSHVSTYNNLSVRVTVTYQGIGQGHLVTVDMLCGTKVLDVNRGAVMIR